MVIKHGDCKSPIPGGWIGPLSNGRTLWLIYIYKWGGSDHYLQPSPGMILQDGLYAQTSIFESIHQKVTKSYS